MPDANADAQQRAAQYASEQRLNRLRATLDRKARDKADVEVRWLLDRMLASYRNCPVTARDLIARLPEVCHGRPIIEVSSMLVDAHHRLAMDRNELGIWLQDLRHYLYVLRERRYEEECLKRHQQPMTPPVARIPPEDADALAALA